MTTRALQCRPTHLTSACASVKSRLDTAEARNEAHADLGYALSALGDVIPRPGRDALHTFDAEVS